MPAGNAGVRDGGLHISVEEGDMTPEMDPFYNPIMPPPQQSSKKKKARKTEGKQPTFLTKLYS